MHRRRLIGGPIDAIRSTHYGCLHPPRLRIFRRGQDGFRQRKVEYLEIDLSKEPDKIPELLEMTNGERITPVIVDNGSVTIGFKGGY